MNDADDDSSDSRPESRTARTLADYGRAAEQFWEQTRDHDVDQNRIALLDAIEGAPPYTILDFGCGPGRDLAWFSAAGHDAVGLEGAPEMAALARRHSGCEVLERNFLATDLPAARFDGVFANASLFHVPLDALARVLGELRDCLKPRGVLFCSNPRGGDSEGWNGERYGVFHELAAWRGFVTTAGFTEIRHYYRPAGKPRAQQPWLATVWRRR